MAINHEQRASLLAYWQTALAGAAPVLELPLACPRPAQADAQRLLLNATLDGASLQGLQALAGECKTSLDMLCVALTNLLCYRYSRQEDFCSGWQAAASPLQVLRIQADGQMQFTEFVKNLSLQAERATAQQGLSLAELVAAVCPQTDPAYAPLFQVLCHAGPAQTWQHAFAGLAAVPDLILNWQLEGSSLRFELEYNPAIFQASAMQRLLGHFQQLAQAVAARPQAELARLNLLRGEERSQLLEDFSGIAHDYPHDDLIHAVFERQAARLPQRIAASFGTQHITYEQLNQRANQLARHLQTQGVGLGDRVAICFERGLDVLVALLGILKAGAVYVPVDPRYPMERIKHILDDSEPKAMLTHQVLAAQMRDSGLPLFVLDGEQEALSLAAQATDNLDPQAIGITPAHLAYIIYTSGSTGLPKGAMIEHAGIPRIFGAAQSRNHFCPDDVWTVFHSIAFDFSVWEIWGGLLHGGRLVMVPAEIATIPQAFYALLCREGVTVLNQTPSAFRQLVAAQESATEKHQLRRIIFAGEAIELQILARWFRQNDPQATVIVNMYGATETTVHATHFEISRQHAESGARGVCGKPLEGYRMYVLDALMQPVPIGVAGDIYLGGRCVARGYMNRPELNAERYLPNPFTRAGHERIYKTGDVGYWMEDGNLEFSGRSDFQVKIRGFRIELGEIEHALLACDNVREAVILAREDVPGDKRLVAYLVAKQADPQFIANTRRALQSRVPDYMTPSQWVVLDALPLNPNRKIDRKALPKPGPERIDLGEEYLAPRTPTEQALAAIWANLLQVDQVGLRDHFFVLGGNSLLAVQAVAQVRQALQGEVSLRDLFDAPCLEDFCARIRLQSAAPPVVAALPIAPRPEHGLLRTSFAQQRLWLVEQYEPGTSTYNIPSAWKLAGVPQVPVLQEALNQIVRRHEALRTTFVEQDGEPYQVVHADLPLSLQVLQVADLDDAAALTGIIRAQTLPAFDLQHGPLLRAYLLRDDVSRENGAHSVLLLVLHHIVADGWSVRILLEELCARYAAAQAQQDAGLTPLALQYPDFAAWQRQMLSGEYLHKQQAYWQHTLDGAPAVLELPTDRPRPAHMTQRGETIGFSLDAATTAQLRALGAQAQASLFMTMAALFNVLLHRYSGQTDICIGYPAAQRNHPDLQAMIGFFANTLVLRTRLQPQQNFLSLLQTLRTSVLDAEAHQDMPFDMLVGQLCSERDPSYSPLFQVMLALNNTGTAPSSLGSLALQPLAAHYGGAKYDLVLLLDEIDGGLRGALEYNSDLFERASMERMLDSLRCLTAAALAEPGRPLCELDLLSQAQRRELQTRTAPESRTGFPWQIQHGVVDLWYQRLQAHAKLTALEFGAEMVSYQELEVLSNRIAWQLRAAGVRAQDKVALLSGRSVANLAAMLAILKCGACYVPLDRRYPLPRQRFILQDSQAKIALAAQDFPSEDVLADSEVVCLSLEHLVATAIAEEQAAWPGPYAAGGQGAYIMYTSGSTGQPKGALIPHAGIVRLTQASDYCTLDHSVRMLHYSSLGFDAATFEIWGALLNGATVVGLPEAFESLQQISNVLHSARISTLFCTVALFEQLVQYEPDCFAAVREVLVGGEVLNAATALPITQRHPGLSLVHVYGPTENTTFSTYRFFGARARAPQAADRPYLQQDDFAVLPLGHPVCGVECLVVDDHLQLLPVGVPGELLLGGSGLALEYLNQAQLSAERFIDHPFIPGARLYRSGDIVKWNANGELVFLRRKDNQVKIRGFRVELDEVQTALEQCEGVLMARVIAHEFAPGDRRLLAYLQIGDNLDDAQQRAWLAGLRQQLAQRLPGFMLPSTMMILPAFPLTPNGKIDWQRLPSPTSAATPAPAQDEELSAVEEFLQTMWQEVLKIEHIGLDDDFFELGGHSLSVMQINARLQQNLGVHLPVKALFQYRTVRSFAQAVEELLAKELA